MKLKDFRNEKRYTQQKLADLLNVNQQTVARWEKGQTEPNIKQLRDLAMIFETSVDAILGKEKPERLFQNFINDNSGDANYFWGHIGINLYGVNKTKWYPITESEMNRFYGRLANQWFVFETLNNRYVALNQKNTRFITFSHDNADPPQTPPKQGDFALTWKEDMQSLEFYRGLDEYGVDGFQNSDTSKAYQEIINDYIKENKLNPDDIIEFTLYTKVYDRQGNVLDGVYADEDSIGSTYVNLEDVEENEIITILSDGNYYSFNESDIALIESPRLEVKEHIDNYLKQLDE